MFTTIAYYFWWFLLTALRILQYIVIAIIPTSVIEKLVVRQFKKKYGITIVGEEQAAHDDELLSNNACVMVVHNRKFYKRLANDDLLALGETYMERWWDTEDLVDISSRLAIYYSPWDMPLMPLYDRVQILQNQHTLQKSLQVVDEHYNLGNEMYEKMLGSTMNYTCAYWKPDTKTLDEAQINKMDLVARKLKLQPGMKVLDIGSGFGATAKYLAENYGVSVVGYNISEEQVAWATVACKGLDVEFRLEDYRQAVGSYDRIYTLGFFEHVGVQNYREFFQVCDRVLKDDGLLLLHSITLADHSQPRTDPWMNRYIFPGGQLPYPTDYYIHSEGLFLTEDIHSFGPSYKLTLLEWYKNFTSNWYSLEAKYGGFQDGKFYRMWSYYLLLCAGFFDSKIMTVYQIIYSKKGFKTVIYESER